MPKPQEVLDGCQNPWGCAKIAVKTVEVDGTEFELCAHCADQVAGA